MNDLARTSQRTDDGKFLPGNKLGRGNPHAKRLHRNRSTFLMRCVTEEDVITAYDALMALVRKHDLGAIREFLDRACGKVVEEVDKNEQAKIVQLFLTQVNMAAPRRAKRALQAPNVEPMHTDGAQTSPPGRE